MLKPVRKGVVKRFLIASFAIPVNQQINQKGGGETASDNTVWSSIPMNQQTIHKGGLR